MPRVNRRLFSGALAGSGSGRGRNRPGPSVTGAEPPGRAGADPMTSIALSAVQRKDVLLLQSRLRVSVIP